MASTRNDKACLALLGFLGFLGFFTYFNANPDKKWDAYTGKEKIGTLLLFFVAAAFLLATLVMLLRVMA
ncbi:MAG: hypothetical protein PHG20_13090 [Geobacteraceae bacterium]|nr:hypothetical protein [Geobacteraceae bacterium]